MKRGLCSVLATIVCTSLFVGCQGNDEVDKNITEIKDNKVTLTVLTNRTDIVNTDLKAFSDKYTENNPNVKMEDSLSKKLFKINSISGISFNTAAKETFRYTW